MDLVMTKWNGSFVHWPLFWTRRLPEGIMIIHQLPPTPRSFNLETAMGIWWAHPFFFFFFGSYGAWGSTPPQLLLNGGVACVVATCHARISWGVLGSSETVQFSHVFWGASFLNPLCFLSMLTFFKFQSILCLLLRIFSFFCALLLWFLCLSPWFLYFTFFFRYAPLFFLFFISFWSFTCFLFLCFVPFLNFAFSVSLMVDYSDIRITSPSVAFFFARLGVFIGFSSGHCP